MLSGAATSAEQDRLEHRLLGFVPVDGEFSAGRYATLAHAEIDQLIAEGRRPLVVGGTGLYLIAALSDLDLRPPVPEGLRAEVEQEIAERGSEALHAELPPDLGATVHANDRKRVARLTELTRAGIEPPRSSERLWTDALRHRTAIFGLVLDRDELDARIDRRVDAMVATGAVDEVRAADAAGASRTVRAAIGFEELLAGDVEAMKTAQRRFARRQLTWMRKMAGVTVVERSGREDADIAAQIAALLD